MKRAVFLLFLLIFSFTFVAGCRNLAGTKSAGIEMSLAPPEQVVTFELRSDNLTEALKITGGEKAKEPGIFFETVQGRELLRGQPDSIIQKNNYFSGEWKFENGKKVAVDIVTDCDDFIMNLSSKDGPAIVKWGINIEAGPDEYVTGLMERSVSGDDGKSWEEGVTTGMNLRGQKVEMRMEPTMGIYSPFYLSSRGYGLFIYGTWPGRFDVCSEYKDLLQIELDGPELRIRFYTSKEPAEIVKAHSLQTGPPVLPPKWAFLPWRWRDEHRNRKTYYDGTPVNAPYNSEVVEDILMMEALDIPCGAYWVDRPWAVGEFGYSDFQWDSERLPNPEKMIDWLDKRGIRFGLWIAPWVMGDMAKTALQNGYTVAGQHEREDSRPLIDFTNPEAKKWWQENGPGKLLKQGVAAFKLDRSEETTPSSRRDFAYDGRSTMETRNDYPVQYVRATYEICREIRGDDFFLFPRAGYTGSSQYSGFWGGDTEGSHEGIRCAIICLLRSSMMGFGIWGSDTGGYRRGAEDREVCARWLAFSCFCPFMEVGPTKNRGLWDRQEEPHYDSELLAVWRLYSKLHTYLADYSYTYAKEAHQTGMPIARPLFLAYPTQKQCRQDWQTYLYGREILVSPIWRPNKSHHTLYLPAGENWRYAWDKDKVFKGGQKVTVSVPLHKIPIFVREGSDMRLPDLNKLYAESVKITDRKPDLRKLEQSARF